MRKAKTQGFTLIEVMVSLAIFMMMTLIFSGVISQISKQLMSSTQKLETLELKNRVTGTLSYEPICSCLLEKFSTKINLKKKKNAFSRISEIRTDCEPDAPLIAAVKSTMPGTQTQLAIKDIAITDIRPHGTSDTFSGILNISFENDSDKMVFKTLQIGGFFTTKPSSPETAKEIQTCAFGAMGVTPPATTTAQVGYCPAGEYVSGMDEDGFYCTPLPSAKPSPTAKRSPAKVKPGKGCDGAECTSIDYGPCEGKLCRTNGFYCDGAACIATGIGATCEGKGCCAGPHCKRYWDPGDLVELAR